MSQKQKSKGLEMIKLAGFLDELPDIQEIHVTWSGKSVWEKSRALAKLIDNELELAFSDGKVAGLERAQKLLNNQGAENGTTRTTNN